jgi:hypothetical protein
MKTLLTSLILPAVLLIFGYYYTKEKPDIRYALSERIPVKLAEESSSESLQQLEIKNVGSSEAKRIQLIIKAKIISYDLLKYSKADTVNEFRTGTSAEIVYPALPPQGSFRLLIRSSGDGISKDSLSITHTQGKGKEAFAESKNSYLTLFLIAIVLFYLLLVFVMIRNIAIDSLESKAAYDSDSILRRKKPLYLNAEKWKSIRKKALEDKLSRDRISASRDIENSQSYVFLNINRPDYLNEEEWHSLVKKASDILSTVLSQASIDSYTAGQVLNLIKVRKPLHFHGEDWSKLTKKISGIFVLLLKTDYTLRTKEGLLNAMKEKRPDQVPEDTWSDYLKFLEQEYFNLLKKGHTLRTEEGLLNAMKEKRPDQVPEDTWSDYLKFLEQEYFNTVSEKMEVQGSPIDYLEEQQLGCLPQDKADALVKRAYELQLRKLPNVLHIKDAAKFVESERPKWIKDFDYEFLMMKAKGTIDLDVLTQKYHGLLWAFESILIQGPLSPSKPEKVTDEEWQKILKIDSEFRACKQGEKKLAEDKIRVSTLKTKIERQLEIIHNLLVDPGSIDRIEDYSNVFSPGNFENLRLLSKHLKASP